MVSESQSHGDLTSVDTNNSDDAPMGQDLTIGSEHQHVLRLTGFMLL